MKNPGSILEPACLYADQCEEDLGDLIAIVRQYSCRSAVVHMDDLKYLTLSVAQTSVVIDFPYGKGGTELKCAQAEKAFLCGVRGIDVCVNLSDVLTGKFGTIYEDFRNLSEHTANVFGRRIGIVPEIKAIVQLPYLWQYAPDFIAHLVFILAKSGVSVIKDWTTVMNFSKPVDVSLQARLAALDFVKDSIVKNKLPLKIKIAGGVRTDNAAQFVKHGADILGVSVQYVPDVVRVLEVADI